MGDGESFSIYLLKKRSGILHLGSKKKGGGRSYLSMWPRDVGSAVINSLEEEALEAVLKDVYPPTHPTRLRYLNFVIVHQERVVE
jgi:hypothetical protein